MSQTSSTICNIKALLTLVTFFAIVLIDSGCVYVPTPAIDTGSGKNGAVSHTTINSLKLGETTRGDLLLLIGMPDERYGQDRYFIYEWEAQEGLFYIGLGGGGSGFDHIAVHYLCVEFDETSRIKRYEHIKSGLSKTALEAHDEMMNWRQTPSK